MNRKGPFVVGLLLYGMLWISVSAGGQTAETEKNTMALDREHSILAAYSGEPIHIALTVPTPFRSASGKIKATIMNAEGKTVETLDLNVDTDASKPLVIIPKVQDIGYYDIALAVWQGDKHVQDLYTSFSILTPVSSVSDDSRFGVYTNSDVGIFNSMLPLGYVDILSKSGARWGTFTTYWFLVQPKADTWDWAALDHRFECLKQANIQPIPTIFGIPEWASSYRPDMPAGGDAMTYQVYPPKDMKAWGDYVYKFVDRYRAQMKYIRVWNEFDNDYFMGTPHEFAEMLKVAYREAHRAKPDIQVIIDTSFAKTYYYEMLWRDGAAESFDVIAIHNYHQLEKVLPPEQTMFRDEYKSIRMWRDRRVPGRPIIDDEFGLLAERSWIDPTWRGQGSLAHANQMVRTHLLGLSTGLERMVWFPAVSYHVPFKGKIYTESAGLLRPDLAPQPAFSAYQTMSTLLQNAKFTKEITMPSPTQYAFEFHAGNSSVTAIWSIADHPEWASFTTGEEHVELLSMLGTREAISVEDGFFSLPLTHAPQYLITGTEVQSEVRRLRLPGCAFKFNVGGNPGDLERPIAIEAENHRARPGIFSMDIEDGYGLTGFPMQLSLLINAPSSSDGASTSTAPSVGQSGKIATPSGTASGHFPVGLKILENDGYPVYFPITIEVKTQEKPLWQAATSQMPAQYVQTLPSPRPVDSIRLTLPVESGYFYRVEAKRTSSAGQEEWWTVRPPGMGHGTESIRIQAAISAIRVTFEQLLSASDLEDPKQFQPIPSDPKNTPEDYIRAGGWYTGKKQISLLNTEGHTGSHCIQIESDNRADGWSTSDQYLRVKENTCYSFSAYGKVPQDADYNGYSSLVAVNGDTKQYMAGVYLTHADSNWHRYFFTIRTDPGQTCLRLSCVVNGRGKAMFDDIMAVEGTQPADIPQIVSLDVKE